MTIIKRSIRPPQHYGSPALFQDVPEEKILEGVAMTTMTGILHQLGWLAFYSKELFEELFIKSKQLYDRINTVNGRLQRVNEMTQQAEQILDGITDTWTFYSNRGVEWHQPTEENQQLFTKETMPASLKDIYEKARAPPDLSIMDKFMEGGGSCLKLYTDPSFFFEEWLRVQMEHRKKIHERRKKKKKSDKSDDATTKKKVATVQVKKYSAKGAEFADEVDAGAGQSFVGGGGAEFVPGSFGQIESAPPLRMEDPGLSAGGNIPAPPMAPNAPAPPPIPGAPPAPGIPAAPAPPMAPPVPGAPAPPAAPAAPSGGFLSQITAGTKLKQVERPVETASSTPQSALLNQIQKGLTLKKVVKEDKQADASVSLGGMDVSAILKKTMAIRQAVEFSSDEESESSEDDDWMYD